VHRNRLVRAQRIKTAGGRRWRPLGDRQIGKDGYVSVKTTRGWEKEHRVVMAQKLGRPLSRNEEVHHRNADRGDNHPDNLELWLTGVGQHTHRGLRADQGTGMLPMQHD
jgi:hypothetical protein